MSTTRDPSLRHLDDCGCCTGIAAATPAVVENRPGLSAIAYRSGTWHDFKQSMLAALSSDAHRALAPLATRADDDVSIAFLDAVAMVADVLTFYNERVANESYLRTATERLSILELARLIGYQLKPGIAASTLIAFEIEAARERTAPYPTATIDIGVKVQSVPGQDEVAQTFETIEKITASAEWNTLRPSTTTQTEVTLETNELWIDGTATDLRAGSILLLVDPGRTADAQASAAAASGRIGRIRAAEAERGMTAVRRELATAVARADSLSVAGRAEETTEVRALISTDGAPYDVRQVIAVAADFAATRTHVVLGESLGLARDFSTQTAGLEVYALRTATALFGANAPDWNAMSTDFRNAYQSDSASDPDWPGFDQVFNESVGTVRTLDLDAVHDAVLPGTWLVITAPGELELFWVRGAATTGRSQFAVSAKLTEVALWGGTFGAFDGTRRQATVHAQAERLVLADVPIDPPLSDRTSSLTLDRAITPPDAGRLLLVRGEDDTGAQAVESVVLAGVVTAGGVSQLTFTTALVHRYRLDSMSITANVARATHGETVQEVLGGGDASRPYQRFRLKQGPLTFTRDPIAPSGGASTLTVRVNDAAWDETRAFVGSGPRDRVFATQAADDGSTTVAFGDGIRGARLPSGQENIRATYRKGSGIGGNVRPGQLTTLLSRPLNVKAATNPLPATGGDDAEARDDARTNAPRTVLTLDRVVSLRDYEDFARAYAGIAKALATWTWDGNRRGVFVTVAGPAGADIVQDDIALLTGALRAAGDPFVPLRVASYRRATFTTSLKLKVDPARVRESVAASAVDALRTGFGFARRSFGQPVALSDVIATVQAVDGVVAVDVDLFVRNEPAAASTAADSRLLARLPAALSLAGGVPPAIGPIGLIGGRAAFVPRLPPPVALPARLPEPSTLGTTLPAELLLLADDPIIPGEMT